jgi:hypothetical protein
LRHLGDGGWPEQARIAPARRGAGHRADPPGDVLWFAPGEEHWDGAGPTTAMTHIAIQEEMDGKHADWLEHVSDADYLG